MQSIRSIINKVVPFSMILVLAFSLVACGDNGYADATNAALANFNSSGQAVTDQLMKLNADNTVVSDPDWKDATNSALDEFATAGKAFASLPEAPEEYKAANDLLTELAFETNSYVDIGKSMVETEDVSQVDALNESMSKINDLVSQVDAAIGAANQ